MDNLQHNQTPIHTIVKNIKGNTTNKGIYKIACIVNNKFYIGSSIEIDYRMRAHISMLRKNKHKNKHLQAAYNKYGENNFTIECIEACPDTTTQDEIILLEQKYLDTLKPWNNSVGYNMSEKAYCPPSRIGTKLTEEHKQIISMANKDKVVSETTRLIKSLQRRGKTLKEINGKDWIDKRKGKTAKEIFGPDWIDPRIGIPRTKEVCKKISDLKGGNTLLTLQNKFTGILQTKACYEWRKEGIDVHALKCNRQTTSKHWKLYSSVNPP